MVKINGSAQLRIALGIAVVFSINNVLITKQLLGSDAGLEALATAPYFTQHHNGSDAASDIIDTNLMLERLIATQTQDRQWEYNYSLPNLFIHIPKTAG